MKIKKKLVFLLLFIMVLLSSLLLIKEGGKKEVIIYDVAVIVRGENSDEWSIIKAGMEQASLEMNINLRVISLLEENNAEEQRQYIQKEVDSGTDALVISPADYRELSTVIEEASRKIPVVLFESTIEDNQNIPYISSDNYMLGQKLADEVIRNGNTRNKLIIAKSNSEYSSLNERYRGFIDEIEKSKNTYEVIELSKEDSNTNDKIISLIKEKKGEVLIALEPWILELMGKAKKTLINDNYKQNVEIYGIGRTSSIIALIEEKIIDATAIQNEFNIGYLSIKTVVDRINNKKIDNKITIESNLINSENMYSKQKEKILFPIVR